MPKTKTFKPTFVKLVGPNGNYLTMLLSPIDQNGVARGDQFSLLVAADGSKILGPDGATIAAPVPLAILNASISGGAAPIQSEIDVFDTAGLLNAYY
jgi:hypothetical protein